MFFCKVLMGNIMFEISSVKDEYGIYILIFIILMRIIKDLF